jgi:prepilin-type N-terminal cleavage/methylation domain-containing protein/prepilin-type processing-associated H-X9-DG protein
VRARANGFTLIELLVVIAIIAILAAILFPIFASAKENGRTVSCSSNLKQIYVGLMGYCEDYGGKMPGYPGCVQIGAYPRLRLSDPVNPLQISAKLLRYVGNKLEIFRCPSDNLVPRMTGNQFDSTDPNWSRCDWALLGCSYQFRFPPAANPISNRLVSFYPKTSRLGIARDAVPFHRSRARQVSANWASISASNLVFLDGHVKLIYGDAYGSTTDLDARF